MTIYIICNTHCMSGPNPHISLRGRAQAGALSSNLQHVPIDACWVSTMHRARETFELFKNKNEIPAVISDDFMEIDSNIIGEKKEPLDQAQIAADINRANRVVERIKRTIGLPENIAIFTHENLMRYIIHSLDNKPIIESYGVDVSFCDVFVINTVKDVITVKLLRF